MLPSSENDAFVGRTMAAWVLGRRNKASVREMESLEVGVPLDLQSQICRSQCLTVCGHGHGGVCAGI